MDETATRLLDNKIKTLDGFRGLAIILVMGYHYLHFFSFGWVGVDLFFVLSGFLITGKLLESLGSNHYFRSFYLKRILRIVPLYYFILFLFFLLIPLLLPSFVSVSFKDLLQQQVYYWTFTDNVYDAAKGWPLNVILIHCWSLACEMQFYLVWPFVIWVFYKKENGLVIVLLFFFIAAFLFRYLGQSLFPFNDIYRYTLLPCRIDAFSAGALLYIFLRRHKIVSYKTKLFFTALITLAVILIIMFVKQTSWHFSEGIVRQYGFTLNAVFWTALMGFALAAGKTIFSNNVITRLGKYSYGMYLFHLPVFIIIARLPVFNNGNGSTAWLTAAAAFIITYGCSFTSYHLLEKHFLKLKPVR